MFDVKLRLTAACVLAVILAGFVSMTSAGFDLLRFGLVLIVFALGMAAVWRAQEPDVQLETFLDSDWRHYERLIALSPEQFSKLQSLTRRPDQKAEALAWIETQMTLQGNDPEPILRFFVTSGWASSGVDPAHAANPEWQWAVRDA